MYRYYSACDLFVFPGIRESLGLVFLEAQSCGLPVVAFDNAGVPGSRGQRENRDSWCRCMLPSPLQMPLIVY